MKELPFPRWRPEFLARMRAEKYLEARGEGLFPPGMQVRADGLELIWRPIKEGDVLWSIYGEFAFGWCEKR